MQPPARHVEVLGRDGRLQRSQYSRDAKWAVLWQAGGVAPLDPAPQPLVADRHPAVFPGLPESVAATRMGSGVCAGGVMSSQAIPSPRSGPPAA